MKELKEHTDTEILAEVQRRILFNRTPIGQTELKSNTEPTEKPKFDVKCSICGEMTQVPFKPRENYPIKCYKCYKAAQNE